MMPKITAEFECEEDDDLMVVWEAIDELIQDMREVSWNMEWIPD